MNAAVAGKLALRHVVLALEGRVAEASLVEAAVSTASLAAAELISVFVEDEELLGAAALPVALELSRGSGVLRPLDAADLEHRFRAEARAAEQQIAAAAQRAGVVCSFRVTRRDVAGALGELASGNDLLIMAPAGLQRGFAAATLEPGGEELVVFDGSAAGIRALHVAALRATRVGRQLTVGLAGTSPSSLRERVAQELSRIGSQSQPLSQPFLQPQYVPLESSATLELLRLLQMRQPAEVVLPTNDELLIPQALGAIARGLHCAALLVR